MGWGLSLLLKVSVWVATWPRAILPCLGRAELDYWVVGSGIFTRDIGQGLRRYLGFGLATLCFVIWSQTPRPDMRLSDAGQVAFWDNKDEAILYVGRKRLTVSVLDHS